MDDIQWLASRERLERHRHASAYAAIVLDGGYLESGDHGRRRLESSQVVIHAAYEAHSDRVEASGARVLNLELSLALAPGFYQLVGLDEILGAVRCGDVLSIPALIEQRAAPLAPLTEDWPDVLALEIGNNPQTNLTRWAEHMGLRISDLSPGFFAAFGTTPKRFRAEAKSRKAAALLGSSPEPLAQIAIEAGFTDQAHMTRAVFALTGLTPGKIRRGVSIQG